MKLLGMLKRRGARAKTAAFSLMEVTIGMGILGTVAIALFSGFTTGFFTMQLARENLRATQIMLEKMETIRLYSWDQITAPGFIPPTFTEMYDPSGDGGAQGLAYAGTMTVADSPIASSYSSDMKQVKVTVSWKTGNLNRSREFTSYVSRYGMQDYIY